MGNASERPHSYKQDPTLTMQSLASPAARLPEFSADMIYFLLAACPLVLVALIYFLSRYETESPRAAELSWAIRESETAPPKTCTAEPRSNPQSLGPENLKTTPIYT